MHMIDILLKYIIWYEFLNDFVAQSDFNKTFVTKKLVLLNHFYLKQTQTVPKGISLNF